MTERDRATIKCEIVERIGELNSYPTGWKKEFNLVRWNDKPEKYDIRDWSPGHERMSRGVTLHEEEVLRLMEFCDKRFNDSKEGELKGVTVIVTDRTAPSEPAHTDSDAAPAAAEGTPAPAEEDVPF